MPSDLKYSGCSLFRQRIVAATLSGKSLKINKIREKDDAPGLQDFEASFLRLVEKIVDGSIIEINETGSALKYRPGILLGGEITHDCGTSRAIGWFIEGILPLAVFCKTPLELSLTGITNDALDLSVDLLRTVTFPLLQNFGISGIDFKVKRRGAYPKGGGLVLLRIPVVRSLQSIYITDEGLIKRVRGIAFCTKISPTIVTRVVDSCRGVLNNMLPDVFIHTDHYKGKEGGDSPGYSLTLVAQSTTGALLSVERTARTRMLHATADALDGGATAGVKSGTGYNDSNEVVNNLAGGSDINASGTTSSGGELPEDIGKDCAMMLLNEIYRGGVIDSIHQPLVLMLMVLTPEDVSKVRFGALTEQAILTLQLLRDAYGVYFKIAEDVHTSEITVNTNGGQPAKKSIAYDNDDEEDEDEDDDEEEEEEEEEEDDDDDGGWQEDDDDDDEDDDDSDGDDEDDDDDDDGSGDSDDEQGAIAASSSSSVQRSHNVAVARTTILLSCTGIGFVNANRKVT